MPVVPDSVGDDGHRDGLDLTTPMRAAYFVTSLVLSKWLKAFETLKLAIGVWQKDLGLYPRPASWLFERSLHFMARLDMR
jgi:hypothetical protein